MLQVLKLEDVPGPAGLKTAYVISRLGLVETESSTGKLTVTDKASGKYDIDAWKDMVRRRDLHTRACSVQFSHVSRSL